MASAGEMKYIVVTGGTVSGLGKGITISRCTCIIMAKYAL